MFHLVNVCIRAGTSRLPLPWRLSTVPVSLNFLSNLLMLPFVHLMSGNSFLNCFVIYPFNWYIFSRILSSLLKTTFTNNAVTYLWRLGSSQWDDVTSDCQMKYVQSHGHVTNSALVLLENNFNFMLFLTLEEFWRSVKFWPSYSKLNLAHFWDIV